MTLRAALALPRKMLGSAFALPALLLWALLGCSSSSNPPQQTPKPAAPTVAGTVAGDRSVAVNATYPAYGSSPTGVRIYYATSPGVTFSSPFVTVTGSPAWATLPLPNGNGTPYYLAMSALGSWGESALSNEVSATPQPAAPLSVTATPGDATVRVQWPSINQASYYLVGGASQNPATQNLYYAFSGLTNGTAYTFTVKALTYDNHTVLASGTVTATPMAAAPTLAGTVAGDSSVAVNATYPAYRSSPTGVRIYYATSPGVTPSSPYVTVAGSPAWATLPLPNGNGTPYYLAMSALGSWGESALSNEVSATPQPAAPLSVTATPGDATVRVQWPSVNQASYYLVGGASQNPATQNLYYAFSGLTNGTAYTFTVKALTYDNHTVLASGTVTATPMAAAPTLAGTVAGDSTVAVNATYPAYGSSPTGVRIYYATSPGVTFSSPFVTVTGSPAWATLPLPNGNGTPYYLAMSALGSWGESALSNEVSATPQPAAPLSVTATPGDGSIRVQWPSVNNAYDYLLSGAGQGPATSNLYYLFSGLTNGTTYTFTVKAMARDLHTVLASGTVTATPSSPVATHLGLTSFPSPTASGTSQSFTVTALSASNTTASAYVGTVHFTSSDSAATLPLDYTFVPGDNGVHAFSATLVTVGTQSISATDTATASITGTQTGISVVVPPPAAPTGVSATAGDGQATVSWTAVPGATSYNVYSSPTPGSGLGGTKLAGATSPQAVTALVNGTAYYFVVTAVGPGGESALSSEASTTPFHAPSAWSSTLQITAAPGASIITTDVASAPDGGSAVAWVELLPGSPPVRSRKVRRYDPSALQWLASEQPGPDPSTPSGIFGQRVAAGTLGRVGIAADIFDGSAVTNWLARYDGGIDNATAFGWNSLDALAPSTSNGNALAAGFSQDGSLLASVFSQPAPGSGTTQLWANTFRYAACRYATPPGSCPVNPPDYGVRTPLLLEANLQGPISLVLNSLGPNNLMVAYQNQDPSISNRSALFFTQFDGTLGVESWSPSARIVPGSIRNAFLSTHCQLLATNASGQAVLSYGEIGGQSTLYIVTFAGGAWQSPRQVSYQTDPSIDLVGSFGNLPPVSAGIDGSGTIAVAWVQMPNTTTPATLHVARTGSGGALGTPVLFPLPDAFTPSLPTVLSAPNGDVTVVFLSSGYPPPSYGLTYRIYGLHYTAASGTWDAAPTLLATASNLQAPKASMDAQGRVTVIWQDSTQTSISLRRFE